MVNFTTSEQQLRQKKLLILLCGIIIFFLTSMAKVLIPATIFNDLMLMKMPVNRIAALGSAFLYAYAASQLVMGCFSDRYGGVRILLIGGGLFAAGTILFPLMQNYYLMLVCRIVTGFGAGTIFLGVAKLLGDLFSSRFFSLSLGMVLFFGYLGPTTGTMPMVKLVEYAGWRWAMIIPGLAAGLPLMLIVAFMRGTIKPVVKGQTLEPLWVMVKNKYIWYLSLSCSALYGCYYAITGQIGQKIFSDIFHLTAGKASFCIMILTIIVALNNLVVNGLLKLFADRRKVVILMGTVLTLVGSVLGYWAFNTDKWWFFMIALVITAFPAGFFSIFGTIAKELNTPDYTAMSVAFLNAFVFGVISLYQNITGLVLKHFAGNADAITFSADAYKAVYVVFIIGAVLSFLAVLLVPETRDRCQ